MASQKVYDFNGEKSTGPITAGEILTIQSQGLGIDIEASDEANIEKQTYSGEYIAKVKYRVGNSNYDNVFSVKGGKTQFNFLLRILNVDLLKAFNKLSLNKEEQTIESEISSYTNNPLVSYFEIKNFNTVKYTLGFKSKWNYVRVEYKTFNTLFLPDTPREKVQFNSGLIPGQIADVRADHVIGSGKINLFHATLKLDDANFFKPDYSINSKEIEKVLDQSKQRFTEYVNGIQNLGKEWSNDIRKEVTQLGELSKRSVPNLKPLRDYYTSEIQKIKNEILADKSVKELGELFKKVFGAVAHSVGEIFSKLSELVENISHSFQVAFANVIETIDKELIPQLRDLAEKLTAVAADIAKTVVEIAAGYLATISQLIEKYQPEIKQLAATFGELGQDVARFLQKAYEHVRIILVEQWTRIYNEIKALPVFDEIRAQYEDVSNIKRWYHFYYVL
ncbi:hypothetical protein NQ314_007093 [Rhamnusium bicolor]|uniref:Apolipoprotein B n=1 Tax=Rhamnusium bicolor TaxID=1586634 RepID=A0AAV8YU00_9CUCU|nr:hypothetical protein NQ314_007093 [Rhamnusium bicolor]